MIRALLSDSWPLSEISEGIVLGGSVILPFLLLLLLLTGYTKGEETLLSCSNDSEYEDVSSECGFEMPRQSLQKSLRTRLSLQPLAELYEETMVRLGRSTECSGDLCLPSLP
jgi:hypothetical protein